MRKLLLAIIVLVSGLAFGQGQFTGGGAGFPAPGSAGLCWVSTSATAYAWGSCSGVASTAFSALTGSTNSTAAMVIGTGASLAASGSGTIAATTAVKWAAPINLAGNSTDGSANVLFSNKFIVQGTADAGLPGAQFLGALNTCLIKNTTVTGVLSCGLAGTDYVSPQTTLAGYGITDAVPSSRTVNGKALSGNIVLGLASSDFANQGTTTTVYHGNAAGNPSFGGIVIGDVTDKLGTGTKLATTSATAPVSNKCVEFDTAGNLVVAGSNAACGSGGTGMANPMTTLGDIIYEDATPVPARLPGPTATNGVPQVLTSTPSGGAAVAPAWAVAGVPTDAQVGTTYTIAATDRTSYISFSNASPIAVTLPQAGTTGFASNFAFDACAIGAGTVTFTPTTSTISYATGTGYSSAQTTMALTTGQCAFIYSDNTNYFAFQIKGGAGGSGTVNSGTAGNLAYYATSTAAVSDSSVVAANVVTAASAAGAANQVALSNAADKSVKYATADSTTTHAMFATAGAPAFRAIATTDLPVAIPIGNVGSSGLSGSTPVAISAAGAISCATCVTSAAALVNNAIVIGGGLQASSTISADTTTTHALFATAGAPAFRALATTDLPAIPLSGLATQGANTVVANVTAGSAAPTASAIPAGIQNYVAGTGYNQATAHQVGAPLVCADTSASGTAQVCNTTPSFTPGANDCIIYTTTTANTGTGLTLNVNSLTAKPVAKWQGTTTLAANDVLANKQVLACYDGANWELATIGNAPTGGSGTPAGSNTQVQFNDSAAFGGAVGITYNKTTQTTTLTGVGATGAALNIASQTTVTTPNAGDVYQDANGLNFTASGTVNGWMVVEGTAASGVTSSDALYTSSTNHRWMMNNNNGGAVQVVGSGGDINTSDQVTRVNGIGIQRVTMTADWTCGTGGVSTTCVAATIVGTGGTPLTITLPSVSASYHWQCDGVVGQATAATANSWNVITATNAPTNLEATYQMNTAATAMTGGAITGISAITTTVIGPTWTLGGTATKMPFHVQGSIEGASASGTVVSLQLVAPTVADLVTVYRGTTCSVTPF